MGQLGVLPTAVGWKTPVAGAVVAGADEPPLAVVVVAAMVVATAAEVVLDATVVAPVVVAFEVVEVDEAALLPPPQAETPRAMTSTEAPITGTPLIARSLASTASDFTPRRPAGRGNPLARGVFRPSSIAPAGGPNRPGS